MLVVDDDPWILRMVTATLQKRDYVVDTAREGRQALERATANPPDVIISDVMMPVMDGWTFVEQLRRDPRLSTIPVIFLTALGKDEARIAELGLSPDDFLAKPFRFDALEKRVAVALTSRPAPAAAPAPASAPVGYGHHDPFAQQAPRAQPQPAQQPYQPEPHQPRPQRRYPTPPPGTFQSPGVYGVSSPSPAPPTRQFSSPPAGVAGPPEPQPSEPPPSTGFAPDFPKREGVGPAGPEPLREPPKTSELSAVTEDRRPRRTTALNGRLEQLQISSLLVMMEMERKDGLLSLKDSRTGTVGRIFLRGGQVISAKLGESNMAGKESVYEMLSWKAGTFSFNAMEVEMEDEINSSTTHLLMEGARLIDEANRDNSI